MDLKRSIILMFSQYFHSELIQNNLNYLILIFNLKFTEVAVDLSDKKLQNRVYIFVRSFHKATIYRLCLKKSKDLWKANSIPYHFADWRKFSFLEMVKDQNSKNKNIVIPKDNYLENKCRF
ncbi:hypothetical protein BpHYR1_044833 [Brachionus plicatilis]|uniref:Uncharacterized protein n=1 Tax=Brachionus plicatilis TaxID=10195 RepID=A0A3M7RBK2_BRAPC|nr:hypothetical protein BpHYR1_044833 [Brachionus plicatilis]